VNGAEAPISRVLHGLQEARAEDDSRGTGHEHSGGGNTVRTAFGGRYVAPARRMHRGAIVGRATSRAQRRGHRRDDRTPRRGQRRGATSERETRAAGVMRRREGSTRLQVELVPFYRHAFPVVPACPATLRFVYLHEPMSRGCGYHTQVVEFTRIYAWIKRSRKSAYKERARIQNATIFFSPSFGLPSFHPRRQF